jgi:biotin transport system permease protein
MSVDLYYLDYLAVAGHSWLHRVPAVIKLLALAALLGVVLSLPLLTVSAGVFVGVLLLAMSARLPMLTVLTLAAYPLIFLVLLFLSIERPSWLMLLGMALRVVAITASVIVVLLTTSYPAIFSILGRVLPAPLVAALFFTYRALFILSVSLTNVRTALHLRGGVNWRRPRASLINIGTALAHLLVHAIEMSQRMADSLIVRGFHNRIYTLGRMS